MGHLAVMTSPPSTCCADANGLFDLKTGAMLRVAQRLPRRWAVTDIAYEQELGSVVRGTLIAVQALEPRKVLVLMEIRARCLLAFGLRCVGAGPAESRGWPHLASGQHLGQVAE